MARHGLCAVAGISLALAVALAPPAAGNSAVYKQRIRPGDEANPKGPGGPPGHLHPTALGSESYQGTTADGLTWDRPLGCGPEISGLGPVRYHAQLFTVDADGFYDISSAQGFDGYLHLYAGAFLPDPPGQTQGCIAANDDAAGGIGSSEIPHVNLGAGTAYFLVTSGFAAANHGTFTNTLGGPGEVAIGGRGGDLALTVTPSVEAAGPGDPFFYDVVITNHGPGAANAVEVTATPSANLSVEHGTCGSLPWSIGTLAEGASVSCRLMVTVTGCGPATLTASAQGNEPDEPADNTATGAVNSNRVADPDFVAGSPSSAWTETSTRFGTPLCTAAVCGTGTGTGPSSGTWWAWFGGARGFEEGRLTQTVTVPSGEQAFLAFDLEMLVCSGDPADFLEVRVDGNRVFHADATDARCGVLGYRRQAIDLAAYADDGPHVLELHSVTASSLGSNFFVDDVSVFTCRGVTPVEPPGIPALDTAGLALLTLALTGGAMWVLRRRGRTAA